MAEGTSPTRATARRPERVVLLLGLLVVAGAVAWAGRPVAALFPPQRVALDVSGAQPDGGIAYRVPLVLPADVPSDKDGGRSHLELLEDGRPLVPHALHQAMRDGAAGRFSHWGGTLYLSASDGGDPRAGGHVYEILLPGEVPAWTTDALLAALAVGLLLVVVALVLPLARRRGAVAALPAALALATCALLVLRSSWWHGAELLDAAAHARPGAGSPETTAASSDDAQPPRRVAGEADPARPGNVTRLLPGGVGARFVARGPAPGGGDARRVTLTASSGVEREADLVRLVPGGPGLVATLDPPLPLDALAELALAVRVRSGGELELRLADADGDDRKQVQVALPVEAHAEEQTLRVLQPLQLFVGRDAVAVSTVELRAPAQAPRGAELAVGELVLAGPTERFRGATHGEQALARDDEQRPAAWQSVPGRFELPLAGDGDLVKAAVTLFGDAPVTPVRARVLHRDAAGRERLLVEDALDAPGPWRELATGLPRASGARGDVLVLEVDALPAGSVVAWSGVRLVDRSRPPRRVLMVLLDTLRADALSCFGSSEATTPTIDALAASGVRFDACYAQAHWTRPSMPSLMTSRYVAATGVDTVGQQLPASYTTLAEAFAEAGFLTLADIANTNAGPSAGLDQGFDRVRLYGMPGFGSAREQLLEGALPALLAASREEDLFLSLHLMDAHGPYGPFEAPDVDDTPDGAPLTRHPKLDRDWTGRVSDAGRRHWYHRDVEAMDAALGAFLDVLGATFGADGRAALAYAIVADHGEYLGEHGQWGHGWYGLLPEIVHVPLVLGAPGLPAGAAIATPVENLDVAPTLLALAGVPASALPDADGRSLLPLVLAGDAREHALALSGVRLGTSEQLALYGERVALLGDQHELSARLLRATSDAAGSPWMLADDPSDRDASLIARTLRTSLAERFVALWSSYAEAGEARRAALWDAALDGPAPIDAGALRELEAMGYLQR